MSQLAFYVACFSEVEDSLSQWRGYCPPGFGYSIGFDGDCLRTIAAVQGFALGKCIYNRSEQVTAINNWVESTLTDLATTRRLSEDQGAFQSDGMGQAISEFLKFAPYMKNSRFSDEREWRLVALIPSNDNRVRLRPGKSMLVPYVPIDLELPQNPNLLWKLRIGPTPHDELALAALSLLHQKVKIRNGISPSTVPYRDW